MPFSRRIRAYNQLYWWVRYRDNLTLARLTNAPDMPILLRVAARQALRNREPISSKRQIGAIA